MEKRANLTRNMTDSKHNGTSHKSIHSIYIAMYIHIVYPQKLMVNIHQCFPYSSKKRSYEKVE